MIWLVKQGPVVISRLAHEIQKEVIDLLVNQRQWVDPISRSIQIQLLVQCILGDLAEVQPAPCRRVFQDAQCILIQLLQSLLWRNAAQGGAGGLPEHVRGLLMSRQVAARLDDCPEVILQALCDGVSEHCPEALVHDDGIRSCPWMAHMLEGFDKSVQASQLKGWPVHDLEVGQMHLDWMLSHAIQWEVVQGEVPVLPDLALTVVDGPVAVVSPVAVARLFCLAICCIGNPRPAVPIEGAPVGPFPLQGQAVLRALAIAPHPLLLG